MCPLCQTNYPGDLGYVPNQFAQAGCGVTSLAMVFAYYGVDTDPRLLNDSLVPHIRART